MTERELKFVRAGRRKARTDLQWLCHNVLDMKKVNDHVHGPLISHLQGFSHVQGTDRYDEQTGVWTYEPLASDPQDIVAMRGKRDRLILAPRGWYKTSVNVIAHTIQWILNFPDITILITHASGEIAEEILRFIKDYFQFNSRMRYFFPEFCPPADKEFGKQGMFNSPARDNWTVSPTVSVSGIESIRTGMHYHLIKYTDCVDIKNSATKDLCEKIIYAFGMSRNLLVSPEYWRDVEGTRYSYGDLYGQLIDDWEHRFKDGRPQVWSAFVMGCYEKDISALGKSHEEFSPDELPEPYRVGEDGRRISRFPEQFSWEALEAMRTDPVTGEYLFASQQLNNPVETAMALFKPEQIVYVPAATIEKMKFQYYYTTVDMAETQGKRSDNTVITTAGIDHNNRRWIVDIRCGKFLPDVICEQLFDVHKKYKPIKMKIERTGYVLGLQPTMDRYSAITGMYPNFDMTARDNQVSKTQRIMGLQPWFRNKLIMFSDAIDAHVKEQLLHELTRFPKYIHDDILDTLADLANEEDYFGPIAKSPSMEAALLTARNKLILDAQVYADFYRHIQKDEETSCWTGLGAF